MTKYPNRLEVVFMAEQSTERFRITWEQGEGDHWIAYRSLPGLNQQGRVSELNGDMLDVFLAMKKITSGKLSVTRELQVIHH